MKKFNLCYKTNVVGGILGYDTVDEAKKAIEKLTKDAVQSNSKFDTVEFFIEDEDMNIVYTSLRYVTSTVGDINDINNL